MAKFNKSITWADSNPVVGSWVDMMDDNEPLLPDNEKVIISQKNIFS